jgi:hypothetical protein
MREDFLVEDLSFVEDLSLVAADYLTNKSKTDLSWVDL